MAWSVQHSLSLFGRVATNDGGIALCADSGLRKLTDSSCELDRDAKISSLAPDADAATRAKLAEQMRHLPSTQLTYVRSTVN